MLTTPLFNIEQMRARIVPSNGHGTPGLVSAKLTPANCRPALQFKREASGAVLLLMANVGRDSKPEPTLAKISQETLAEKIGTTRSRVSTFMNKFRKLGFIHYNGDLQVHNSLLNVVLHDNPHLRSKEED
jgi:hypothetical protein